MRVQLTVPLKDHEAFYEGNTAQLNLVVVRLLANLTEAVEESLWSTVRTIEESVLLMRHLAKHTLTLDPQAAEEFMKKADQAENRANVVRRAIVDHEEINLARVEKTAKSS